MKVYRSVYYNHLTYIKVDGKPFKIVFGGGMIIDGKMINGTFSTNDENIQKAIENDPRFGSIFNLVETYDENKVEDSQKEIVSGITDIQSAREYLIGKGVDHQELNNPKNILKKAEELNLSFPDMKI